MVRYWLFEGFPNLHFPNTDNIQPWVMLGKGREGGSQYLLYVIYGWQQLQIPALHPMTQIQIRCSYPPLPTVLIKQLPPRQCSLTQQYHTQESRLQTLSWCHFLRLWSISSSKITSNPDVHCLGYKVLTLHLCTGAYRKKKPAADYLQKLCHQKLKIHSNFPSVLSKKVSYVSSMKIALSLFQIPSIFQPAVNNKACIVVHESV